MANKIQLRRGLKSSMPTGSAGEPLYATDTRELFVGTGSGNVNMGGSHWYRGTAMSGTSTTANAYSYSACPDVKLDDIYMNTSNGNIYACTTAGKGSAAKWTYQGCIKGSKGDKGDTGADGSLPKNTIYTNTEAFEYFIKAVAEINNDKLLTKINDVNSGDYISIGESIELYCYKSKNIPNKAIFGLFSADGILENDGSNQYTSQYFTDLFTGKAFHRDVYSINGVFERPGVWEEW